MWVFIVFSLKRHFVLQGLTGPIGPPGPGGPNGEKVSIISFFFNLLTIGTEMFFVGVFI